MLNWLSHYFNRRVHVAVCVLPGDDLMSLLFHFLDEFLFVFSADPFFIARVCTASIIVTTDHCYLFCLILVIIC